MPWVKATSQGMRRYNPKAITSGATLINPIKNKPGRVKSAMGSFSG